MSLAKAVISGKVVRSPEKRFTSNNLAVTTFAIDISENQEEALVRVVSSGKLAEKAAEIVAKNSQVIVEGRLQTNTAKSQDGTERRILEISAQNIELMSKPTSQAEFSEEDEILEFSDDNIGDELIDEEEIPF